MDIDEIRRNIDSVDDEIARLYVQRMRLSEQVAAEKERLGAPVENAARENDIICRVTSGMPQQLKLYGKQVFETLFETSKAYQYEFMRSEIRSQLESALSEGVQPFPVQAGVACQGVAGAYSYIAARKMFAIPSISYFRTWDAVFRAVEMNMCEFGVLPIENSTVGSVIGVYDLMHDHKFFIARSVKLKVQHCLLAADGVKKEDIREIISHDQALTQCAKFLKTMPDVALTRCDNTAVAAKAVVDSGRKDIACLASKECAKLYGLKIIEDKVSDSEANYTRFIAISKRLKVYEGANRISVSLDLAHEAGSLNRLLNRFSALGLNLTKLESRPMPGSPFEFCFYFDFEAKVTSQKVRNLLADIESSMDNFQFLGAYEEL